MFVLSKAKVESKISYLIHTDQKLYKLLARKKYMCLGFPERNFPRGFLREPLDNPFTVCSVVPFIRPPHNILSHKIKPFCQSACQCRHHRRETRCRPHLQIFSVQYHIKRRIKNIFSSEFF